MATLPDDVLEGLIDAASSWSEEVFEFILPELPDDDADDTYERYKDSAERAGEAVAAARKLLNKD